MWNKLTLRIKITLLTALTLTIMCACLTYISILNTQVFYDPIALSINMQPIDGETILNSGGIHRIDGVEGIRIVDDIFIGSRDRFRTLSIAASIGIIVIGTFIAYFMAGKSLKSLGVFTRRIMDIDENNLNDQLPLPYSRDEVARLTNAFNNMLEKLDRAFASRKLFAANVAHELKTPLTSMLVNIEVMDEEPSVCEYREVVGITKESIERLTALVQDLLHFNSELDGGRFEDIGTNQLFQKILTDLSAFIAEKGIQVTNEGDDVIKGDRVLLERAFYNVVQNAIKYNTEGGEIKITTHDGAITVEDTGVGIPGDSIPQIFDPFYCVDKSRSHKLGGSGLGLSIAKQIFDKHGIKVTVSSQPEKGTKFFFRI